MCLETSSEGCIHCYSIENMSITNEWSEICFKFMTVCLGNPVSVPLDCMVFGDGIFHKEKIFFHFFP